MGAWTCRRNSEGVLHSLGGYHSAELRHKTKTRKRG